MSLLLTCKNRRRPYGSHQAFAGLQPTHPMVTTCANTFTVVLSFLAYFNAVSPHARINVRNIPGCGLRWRNVDLDAGQLWVRWKRTAVAGEIVEGRVKTEASEAPVDLDKDAVEILRSWRAQQLKDRERAGDKWIATGFVFTKPDGAKLHPDYVSKAFTRLVKKYCLPDGMQLDDLHGVVRNIHSLRHTAASLQIAADVDIAIVSKRLRRSGIAITSDTYGHLIGDVGKRAAEAASAIVPRRRTSK